MMKGKGKRGGGDESALCTLFMIIALVVVSFIATYTTVRSLYSSGADVDEKLFQDKGELPSDNMVAAVDETANLDDSKEDCCRGVQQEYWGNVVKWGSSHKKDSAAECCKACQDMCPPTGECKCNTWVHCGDEKKCGKQHKECWLKSQTDLLKPEVHSETGSAWVSGLIYKDGVGVIALATSAGDIRIQLRPEWAPETATYVRSVLHLRHCTGCQFYRAEGLGAGWDSSGARITQNPPGPPYALLQGTLQTDDIKYADIPREAAVVVKRGMVCLIQGGPDFFISLGDHPEWGHGHTVFGTVLEADMAIVDKIAAGKTKQDKWGEVQVQVLEQHVEFNIKRA